MSASRPPTVLADALHDRYVLERELGRGGMATVYLAHDLRHDRSVALKVLHPELAPDARPRALGARNENFLKSGFFDDATAAAKRPSRKGAFTELFPIRPSHAACVTAWVVNLVVASLVAAWPIFVRLGTPVTNNSETQLLEQQFQVQDHNLMHVLAPEAPGDYVLEYGFYLLSEVGKKYPTFYRRACNITVRA